MRTKNKTYYFIITAMLSAVAGILMSLEFPIPFEYSAVAEPPNLMK